MQQQIFGRPSSVGPLPLDDLTITAKNVNGNLELWVANQKDANDKLNGRYYSAPAANIKSLTIRGTEDNETIIVEGPLGLSGDKTITIVGRDGDDTVHINRIDGPGANDYHGTIKVDGGTGVNKLYVDDTLSTTDNTYIITGTSVTRFGRAPIEYVAISTLGLNAGSGTNVVNIDGVAGTLKLELAGGPGRDKLVMIAGHANDPTLTGFEELVISGGKLTLNTTALSVENMTQSGGTLEGAADVSASKTLAWSGGTMQGAGKTVSLNTSTLTLTGSSTLTDRTLENHGTGNWNGAIIGGGNGTLRNTGYLSGTGTLTGKLVNEGALLPGGAGQVGRITVVGHFAHSGTLAADLGPEGDASDQVVAQTVALSGSISPTSVAGFPAKFYTVVVNQSAVGGGAFSNASHEMILTISGVRYKMLYEDDPADWGKAVLRAVVDVGSRTWNDRNLNGVREEYVPPTYQNPSGSGDPPLAGVGVSLYKAGGQLVATTTSGSDGKYLFADVVVGDYYLVFANPDPDWWRFTLKDAGPDDADSDADRWTGATDVFALYPAQDDLTRDAGLYRLGTIGNLVWHDYYIGGNGIQDNNFGGFANLTVSLLDAQGSVVRVTTTGAGGYYAFDKLEVRDANWDPIAYRVKFTKPPDGSTPGSFKYAFAPKDAGPDHLDSDADPVTGETGLYTFTYTGQFNDTVDCGIQQSQISSGGGYFAAPDLDSGGFPDAIAGVRGRMWVDEDRDGVRDPEELPVPGWVVGLYDAAGRLVAETWTDWGGAYAFHGVADGEYRVRFARPEGDVGFTLRDQGLDDSLDSDADAGGFTATFAVIGGRAAALDAGLVRYGGVSIDPFGLWGDEDDPDSSGAILVG